MNRLLPVVAMIVSVQMLATPRGLAQDTVDLNQLTDATGKFEFSDSAVRGGTMQVWYCRPPTVHEDTRVIFVMHGGPRETAGLICGVVEPHTSKLDAIVLAPQFSTESYPGDSYSFGGMVDGDGALTASEQWGFSVIEHLFDALRRGLGLEARTYDIVGFSGGGQFVHRLVLFMPEARFRRAIAGSPGRYAFPTFEIRFPYGLEDGPVRSAELRGKSERLAQIFGRDFILVLGDADTVDRVREAEAMAQGGNRFARGLRFFATATDEVQNLGTPLRWRLHILHGVDHDPYAVLPAMLDLLREEQPDTGGR